MTKQTDNEICGNCGETYEEHRVRFKGKTRYCNFFGLGKHKRRFTPIGNHSQEGSDTDTLRGRVSPTNTPQTK